MDNNLDDAMESMGCFRTNPTLDGRARFFLNKEIVELTRQTYFAKIPLADIIKVLNEYSMVLLQEDGTEWAGFLCGREGRATFEMADSYAYQVAYDEKIYTPYSNAMLVLTWYRMEMTGNYEVLAYVS